MNNLPELEEHPSLHYFYELIFGELPEGFSSHRKIKKSQLPLKDVWGVYLPEYDEVLISESDLIEMPLAHELFHRFVKYYKIPTNDFLEEGSAEYLRALYFAFNKLNFSEDVNQYVEFIDNAIQSYSFPKPIDYGDVCLMRGLQAVNNSINKRRYASFSDLGKTLVDLQSFNVNYKVV